MTCRRGARSPNDTGAQQVEIRAIAACNSRKYRVVLVLECQSLWRVALDKASTDATDAKWVWSLVVVAADRPAPAHQTRPRSEFAGSSRSAWWGLLRNGAPARSPRAPKRPYIFVRSGSRGMGVRVDMRLENASHARLDFLCAGPGHQCAFCAPRHSGPHSRWPLTNYNRGLTVGLPCACPLGNAARYSQMPSGGRRLLSRSLYANAGRITSMRHCRLKGIRWCFTSLKPLLGHQHCLSVTGSRFSCRHNAARQIPRLA